MTAADNYIRATSSGASWTLPECIGLTGKTYTILNHGTGVLKLSGLNSERITGSDTIPPNTNGQFQIHLVSDATGGCGWTRQ
jgi:hypothetical protein